MDSIEKIQSYIDKAKLTANGDMSFAEVVMIAHALPQIEAVALAFSYGRARQQQAMKRKAARSATNTQDGEAKKD